MFTIYNEEENKFQLVEEPDPSLSYTYADYLQWKFEERVELIKGRIFKMSPAPNPKHQQVSIKLSSRIFNLLEGKNCQVYAAPFDIRLPVKNRKRDNEITNVVQPDICIICDELKIDERGCCGAPDLVIEILSPGNTKKEVKIKFELYEEAGVKEYWIVYPAEENIAVFLLSENGKFNGAKIYAAGDHIESTIKGLSINVNDIFTK
ncbi:MAG: Uma2 family endonuclease [Bacteroidota bacterium]|nr:Uma2 family endonuclease [Bacteroidota bacterium]